MLFRNIVVTSFKNTVLRKTRFKGSNTITTNKILTHRQSATPSP